MAARTWGAGSGPMDGNWNTATNWTGDTVPGAADDVTFDGTDVTNCRVNAVVNVNSITATAAYTGTIDCETDDNNVTVAGDVILACNDVDFGGGDWQIGGDFDYSAVTNFSTNSLSTLTLTGAAKSYEPKAPQVFWDVTISGSYTTNGAWTTSTITITISGTWTMNNSVTMYAGELKVTGTGTFTGAGSFAGWVDGGSITQQDGTCSIATVNVKGTSYIVAGTYASATVNFWGNSAADKVQTMRAGTYTFEGNVNFDANNVGAYTVDCSVNNPSFVFEGEVICAQSGGGTFTWTKGTGSITLSGAGAGIQDIEFLNEIIEDLTMNDVGATKRIGGNGFTTDSLTLTAGTWDCATFDPDIDITGDVTMDCTRVDMGDGTWTCSGNWDDKDVTTFNRDASTIVLSGAAKNITTDQTIDHNIINVSGTYTLVTGIFDIYGNLIVSGTLTLAAGRFIRQYGGNIQVTGTGTMDGAGIGVYVYEGAGISQMLGTMSFTTLYLVDNHLGDVVAAVYHCVFQVESNLDKTFRFAAGTYTFAGNASFLQTGANTTTIDAATNNPNLIFQGNVLINSPAGTVTWNRGNGTITLSGAGAGTQTIDFDDETVEAIVINDAGATKQLTDGLTAASITHSNGTLDPNGQAITTDGDFIISNPADVNGAGLAGCVINIGGAMNWQGAIGDLLDLNAGAGWTLTVTGAASAPYVNVRNSNAGAGSEVQAYPGSVDLGGNTNWRFAVAVAGTVIAGVHRRFRRKTRTMGRM